MRFLLDSNSCIAAMRDDPLVIGRMASSTPSDCAILTITDYELTTGIEKPPPHNWSRRFLVPIFRVEYLHPSFVEENPMPTVTIKDEARQLVERLPDDATWEDLQYQIYFRQAVDAGLKDSQDNRVVSLQEARRRLGSSAS